MWFVLFAQSNLFANLEKHWPQLLSLGGMAILCFLLLRNGSRRRDRKQSDTEELHQLTGERSRDSALADAPDEVLRWQVEMHDTARDLKAELETKMLALQVLIREARVERERLEAVIRAAGEKK